MIYQAALTLHIIGIVLFAGTAYIDYIISKQFWNVYSTNRSAVLPIENTMSKIQKIAGIGGGLIILSGIMMIYINPFWGQQTWFRVKMAILLIVLINGSVFRQKKFGRSLNLLASGNSPNSNVLTLKRSLNTVQLIQIVLLTTMFILSVFKFS